MGLALLLSVVEVKDVEIPQQMQRAMARQAESERERRAKIIAAEGEYQASQRLRQAADRLESPTALQLRLFQTMGEIAVNQNSTIILPIPSTSSSPTSPTPRPTGTGLRRRRRARKSGERRRGKPRGATRRPSEKPRGRSLARCRTGKPTLRETPRNAGKKPSTGELDTRGSPAAE